MSVVALSKLSCFTEISDIPRNKKSKLGRLSYSEELEPVGI